MRACQKLELSRVDSPAYVIDLAVLERNLELLAHAQAAAGCTVLLALKGFAAWATFPLIAQHLDGVAASGPDEARLGREELGKQVHTYCPAFDEASLRETIAHSDHVIFNSPSQIDRFRSVIDEHASDVSFGLRINPQHSEVDVPLYDPCAPGSRLGATKEELVKANLRGIDGLHFHTLCELGADALERTLDVVEEQFAQMYEKCRPYSMTTAQEMYNLYNATQYVIQNHIPGDFVECGVWRGGSAMITALTLLALGDSDRRPFLRRSPRLLRK